MSSFIKNTKNPKTGQFEGAFWLDDYFGPHRYGVKFEDGEVYDPDKQELETNEDAVTTGAKWPEPEPAPDRKPTMYVFINKELQMSPGKLAAQAVHAAMLVMVDAPEDRRTAWANAAHKTVLVMQARDQAHIINIKQYLKQRGVLGRYVIDEGVNEIEPHVITAFATVIVDKEDPDIQDIFSTFSTYREIIRLTGVIER